MKLRNFRRKSGISLFVPVLLALIAVAAPVSAQDSESAAQETDKPSTEAPKKSELEVTADRVRQPLPEPDMQLRLPRLYLADMQPWNWNAMWHASEWANGDSTIPWKYGRVRQGFGGDTHFILNADGAPELKAQRGHPEWSNGMYEVDVTIPEMRPGLIAAPIWLYNDTTKESIAVQIVGKRHMQFTIHGISEGVAKSEEYRLAGDYSGRRMRIAIRRHTDLGLIDIFIDGELAHSFNEESPALPRSAMRPIISLYAGDKHGWSKNWAGEWQPLMRGEKIDMTVHGYHLRQL